MRSEGCRGGRSRDAGAEVITSAKWAVGGCGCAISADPKREADRGGESGDVDSQADKHGHSTSTPSDQTSTLLARAPPRPKTTLTPSVALAASQPATYMQRVPKQRATQAAGRAAAPDAVWRGRSGGRARRSAAVGGVRRVTSAGGRARAEPRRWARRGVHRADRGLGCAQPMDWAWRVPAETGVGLDALAGCGPRGVQIQRASNIGTGAGDIVSIVDSHGWRGSQVAPDRMRGRATSRNGSDRQVACGPGCSKWIRSMARQAKRRCVQRTMYSPASCSPLPRPGARTALL